MESLSCLDLFGPGESDETQPRRVPPRSVTSSDLRSRPDFGFRLPSSLSEGDFFSSSLPPEPQEGNIEYKLKLVSPSSERLQHLITQMKWRLREGEGEAVYEIGVEDNGILTGLSEKDMNGSLDTLRAMAASLRATTQILRTRVLDNHRSVSEILVRKIPDDRQFIDLRLCVLGCVDVGKSTLLGVLTKDQLDNGRGSARLNMFRHLHEVQSGRTSSISHEVLGFDAEGTALDYGNSRSTEEICEKASKLITFIDLAGHKKYIQTTMTGLTSHKPNYIMLVVSPGTVKKSRESLGIILALEHPFFIVISKTDSISSKALSVTVDSLSGLLTSIGVNKIPFLVKSQDDAITAASNMSSGNTIPILPTSSVTGSGLALLKNFLYLLPAAISIKERSKLELEPIEFHIDEIFNVPDVGTVAGGHVYQGLISEDMVLKVGPFHDGSFVPVRVTSIKRSHTGCRLVRATQSASLALDIPHNLLRKGMVILDNKTEATSCQYFQAKVHLMSHSLPIYKGFRCTAHIDNVRQAAVVVGIQSNANQNESKDDVIIALWRFIRSPEFIQVGSRILFVEGSVKGTGRISKTFPLDQVQLSR